LYPSYNEFFDTFHEAMDYQKNLIQSAEVLLDVKDTEIGTTPKTLFFKEDKMKVFHYEPIAKKVSKTPTLIVYALVNKQHLVDIQSDRSFVRNLLQSGADVYIIDWGYPTAQDKYITMDDYIETYLDDAIREIMQKTKLEKINLLGICQGGTFCSIYAALHPEKIKNLVTMIAPIDFEAGAEADNGFLFKWSKYMNVDNLVDTYGLIPGELLNLSFDMLQPFQLMFNKYVSMPQNFSNAEQASNFLRMERWILDSPKQAGEAYRRFIKELYQENRLVKGTLDINGTKVDLKNITMPVLTIYGEKDNIVPPAATIPLNDHVGATDKELAGFDVGHAGIYVSAKSQKLIAPKVSEWLKARDK
jgi:polyhydroxyalkanoate synthase